MPTSAKRLGIGGQGSVVIDDHGGISAAVVSASLLGAAPMSGL